MKENVRKIILSFFLNLLFTAILYNFVSIDNHYSRLILLISFNFCMCIWLFHLTKLTDFQVFFITLLPTLLVDMSVIFTNKELIPFRFPLMTTFSMVGAILGVAYHNSKKFFFVLLVTAGLYTMLTVNYIMPSVFYQVEVRDSKNFMVSSVSKEMKFIDESRNIISLDSILESKKCSLVDIYFIGCSPCEKKSEVLSQVENKISSNEFQIIMICDGRASSFSSFTNSKKLKRKNIIYLFDNNNCLKRIISNSFGYPTELLYKNKDLINIHTGFNETSKQIYFEKTVNRIKSILL